MAEQLVDTDSDSGDDLDIERNGSIPWSRANRLRALLAPKRSPATLASSTEINEAPIESNTPANNKRNSKSSVEGRQRKQWETAGSPNMYVNVKGIASQQSIGDGYIRAAWSPSWQERLSRVDILPSSFSDEAVRALDFSGSTLARGTVLNSFAARLNEVSPEKELRPPLMESDAGEGGAMGARLWEGDLTRHVQNLVDQAQATIGSHAEEIRKAESVLETTLRELTATSAFQEQMLENKLNFLSKVKICLGCGKTALHFKGLGLLKTLTWR